MARKRCLPRADSQGELLVNVDIDIETADWEPLKQDALKNWQAPEQIIYPLDVKPYLLPTAHTPVDGLVWKPRVKSPVMSRIR